MKMVNLLPCLKKKQYNSLSLFGIAATMQIDTEPLQAQN
jgi:hypothetical protein